MKHHLALIRAVHDRLENSRLGDALGVVLLFGLLFGGGYEWVADFAGFATGFALSFVVSPGGWRHMVERIRQR